MRVASKDISDVPLQPRQLVESLEEFNVSSKTTDYSGVRCFFSGTEVAHGRSEQWVYVPKYLLRTPTGEPQRDVILSRPVALKALTLRIAAARELAEEDHRHGGVIQAVDFACTRNMNVVVGEGDSATSCSIYGAA